MSHFPGFHVKGVYPVSKALDLSQLKYAKQRYTVVFYASLRYVERKAVMDGTKKIRGGYRYLPFTVTVYPFLAKIRYPNSKLPSKGITVDFPPVYAHRTKISY